MIKTTLKQRLVCPYCKKKQEYRSQDYFGPTSMVGEVSCGIQCDHCDEYFNAQLLLNGEVVTYSNLIRKV